MDLWNRTDGHCSAGGCGKLRIALAEQQPAPDGYSCLIKYALQLRGAQEHEQQFGYLGKVQKKRNFPDFCGIYIYSEWTETVELSSLSRRSFGKYLYKKTREAAAAVDEQFREVLAAGFLLLLIFRKQRPQSKKLL